MKHSQFLAAGLLLGATLFSSCIDTNKDIKYNKYTKADTEAFTFLKKTYEEALFQQYAAEEYNLGAQSQNIAQEYKTLADELTKLATDNNVLMPNFSADHFVESSVSPKPIIASVGSDTLMRNDLAQEEVGKETPIEKVIHSQEEIVHQFEVASRNTNVSVRHFAEAKLPVLEELLEQSKSSIK